jgi:acyl carrier protein
MSETDHQSNADPLMEKLSAYPDSLRESVLDFKKKPSSELLDAVVTEILRYHQIENFEAIRKEKGDAMSLVEDLGLDSLTMTEIAFDAEDFLEISISNEDMLAITTLQDLKDFARKAAL